MEPVVEKHKKMVCSRRIVLSTDFSLILTKIVLPVILENHLLHPEYNPGLSILKLQRLLVLAVINQAKMGNNNWEKSMHRRFIDLMDRIVAVNEDLKGLKEALASRGYDVVGLEKGDMDKAGAVVISGMEQNLMGMEDIKSRVPVINAAGKTDEEIVRSINEYFGQVH